MEKQLLPLGLAGRDEVVEELADVEEERDQDPPLRYRIFLDAVRLRYTAKKTAVAIFFGILKKTCGTCGLVYAAVSVSHGRLRV